MVIWRGDDSSLYDRTDWERLAEQPDVALKNELFRGLMPESTTSVLDVGCGNGLLINSLPAEWRVVGVDRSEVALEGVKRDKVVASVDSLPFEDSSFDVVVCSEVLEHLPDPLLRPAAAELKRICGRRLLVSVPNDENLLLASTKCDECRTVFNRHGHVRSFDRETLAALFEGWSPLALGECGAEMPDMWAWLSWLRVHFDRETTRGPEGDVCPACGARSSSRRSTMLGGLVSRLYMRRVKNGPGKLYWLFMALEREE